MKQVFCQSLAALKLKDTRSYAAVVAGGPAQQCGSGVVHSKVSGLHLDHELAIEKRPQKPVSKHKVTMCNAARYNRVLNTVDDKCAPHTRSFHKRAVGKKSSNELGQVLALHNRFSVLSDDVPTGNINNTSVLSALNNGQEFQFDSAASIGKGKKPLQSNSTSRYFIHSAACSSQDVCQKSRVQLGSKFGCFPLSPILLYNGNPKHHRVIPDVLQAHRLLRASGLPNFLGLRIPLQTQLNIPAWRFYLRDYFDQQLVDLMEFGFPLDFDRSCSLSSSDSNHTSAVKHPSHVENYITEELFHNAILGPLDSPPFPLHISPFMTRDKNGSDKRRTIIDLSWPKGSSVNDGVQGDCYLGTNFEMHYPSVDHIVDQLNRLGPAAQIFKIDISRAFRHVRIDPGDIDLLGLKFNHKIFIDLSLPFGFRFGSFFFSKISDAIRYIMTCHGHPNISSYIDDFLYCDVPSKIGPAYQFLIQLLGQLGLDISQKKLNPPATEVICLGIMFNTIDRTISIPKDKLSRIIWLCEQWSTKSTCSRQQLQSLLGSLLYISKCVRPARFFLNRMLAVLRQDVRLTEFTLDVEFHRDLKWFSTFLTSFNGVTMYDRRPVNGIVYLDASLTGLGACYNNLVYTLPIPPGFNNYTIVHLEMLNVLVALKLWAHLWADKRVKLYCDNQAVVQVLSTGNTRDTVLGACARNIWLITAMYNISIDFTHIVGTQNV